MTDLTPPTMALAHVPPLLQLLVDQAAITPEQQASVVEAIRGGAKDFSGAIAVEQGYATPAQVEAALAEQSRLKTTAALSDLAQLSGGTAMSAPSELRANWGNNGVNPPSSENNAGASALANMLQNLAMILRDDNAKTDAERAHRRAGFGRACSDKDVRSAIEAGRQARTVLERQTQGASEMADADGLLGRLEYGIRKAVAMTNYFPKDGQEKPVTLGRYLAFRNKEARGALVEAGLEARHYPSRSADEGRGR